MSDLLTVAANDLVKREKPNLVVASGLLFCELSDTAKRYYLKNVLVSSRGGTWGEEGDPEVGYPVLRSTNMRGSYVDVVDAAWRDVPPAHAEACALETGDILVIKSSGSSDLVGKTALFVHPGDSRTYLFSNFTLRLRPDQNIVLPEFLAWFLRSPQALMWRYEAQQTTVGLRNLKTKGFLKQTVPVPELHTQKAIVAYLNALEEGDSSALSIELPPSLDEQRPIVARIEELAALIREAQELSVKAQEETKALLGSAVDACLSTCRAPMVPLQELLVLHKPGKWGDDPIPGHDMPVIRSTEFDRGVIRPQGAARRSLWISEDEALQDGDLLAIKSSGSERLVGEVAVFEDPHDGTTYFHSNFVHLLRPSRETVLPRFLWYVIRSPKQRAVIIEMNRTTSGLRNLRMKDFLGMPLPCPPLIEQRRIVAYLDGLQAQVDELTALQDATQAELDALLPSVLDRAFRGEEEV